MTDEAQGAGRLSAKESDALALNEILTSPAKVQSLLKALKFYAVETEQIKEAQARSSEAAKALAKTEYGLSLSKFKSLASAVYGGDIDGELMNLTSTVDVIEILKESL